MIRHGMNPYGDEAAAEVHRTDLERDRAHRIAEATVQRREATT